MPTLANHPGIKWASGFMSVGPRVRGAPMREKLPTLDDGVLVESRMTAGCLVVEVQLDGRPMNCTLRIHDTDLLLKVEELLAKLEGSPMRVVRETEIP